MNDLLEQDRFTAKMAVCEVMTLDGGRIRMRDLWREGVVVTSFLRHYGCLFCHQAVADVMKAAPRILELGARLVFVGNGSTEQARRFFTEKRLPREGCTVVTDPERETYRAAEMQRGYARTFLTSGSVRAYKDARREGHRITGLFGDLTQLGGMIVTRAPAHLLAIHRSQHAGDHPDMERMIDIVASSRA